MSETTNTQWDIGVIGEDVTVKGRIGWKGYKKSDLRENGPVVIGGVNIKSSLYLDLSQLTYLSREKYEESPEIILKDGDLLLVQRGNGIGDVGYFNGELEEATINPSVIILSDYKYNSKYLFYYLVSQNGRNSLMSISSGSSIPAIYQGDVKKLKYPRPPLDIQGRIVDLLSTFDKKIELNKQINQTLEELAMTIYKQRFVDFSPFQDEEFVTSDLGMIPKEWGVHSIYDLANYINGKAFKTKDLHDQGELPVIKIAELKSGISKNTKYFNDEYQSKHEINDGDVLFAWSASLGVYQWSKGKALLNQHIFNVQPKDDFKVSKAFLYFMLKKMINKFIDIAASRATTMGHITKGHLINEKIALPPYEIFEEIQEELNEYYKLILSNSKEIAQLTNMRDYLLPKLLSGEIDITEAEETAENVMQ